MRVLSLYDGIGGAAQALKNLGIRCEYYYSELDGSASEALRQNHSGYHELAELGDVNNGAAYDIGNVDLLIGGSPCQSFSVAGGQAGFNDPRGQLLFKYIDILQKVKPKYFLLENVASMVRECKEHVDKIIGVGALKINSAWFGPQRRWRYYWTNLPFSFPGEESWDARVLGDLVEDAASHEHTLKDERLLSVYRLLGDGENWKNLSEDHPERTRKKYLGSGGGSTGVFRLADKKSKSVTILASGMKQNLTRFILRDYRGILRYPTPVEYERLQGFPDSYTEMIKKRHHALGNAFSVPTIEAIFSETFG